MPFTVRKVRKADKYTLKIKDDNGRVTLTQIFDTREQAMDKVRDEIAKQVNKNMDDEKKQNNNNNDSEIEEY